MNNLGKLIIAFGVAAIILGAIVMLVGRFMGGGRPLPGDILIRRGNFTIYIPVMTSIVLSLLVTLAFWVVSLFRR